MQPIDILLDMETSDPDDLMTLCLLTSHPRLRLRAVTVTPGTDAQIGLVRHVLRLADLDIPVGSAHPGYEKSCVAGFYSKWFPHYPSEKPDAEGISIILNTLREYPDLTIVTGAPLKNFARLPETQRVHRWVAQGGFAGDNVVPEADRLDKFKGRITCPTFNFNGDPQTALRLLAHPLIERRLLVSKNVCHGIVYDERVHDFFRQYKDKNIGVNLIHNGMSIYLQKNPDGKKFHDPLAACVAMDESICDFSAVEVYRERGEWGSRPVPESNTRISIRAHEERLWALMVE